MFLKHMILPPSFPPARHSLSISPKAAVGAVRSPQASDFLFYFCNTKLINHNLLHLKTNENGVLLLSIRPSL